MRYVKIVTTVPETHADAVREAAGDAIGITHNYSHASFSVIGTGRFLPHEGAKPAVGDVGKSEEVIEERIEWTCSRDKARAAVEAIRSIHPYEVPMIDVYSIEDA